ncbi:TIM barrel protein [uncultured Ilyobacter sp.]|uniref:sugar phosphate isomerase/epimerase family protein n=1 Tax=uncultured Ilyobacter sp. TaxID=544433 RepID=UPI0029C83016|nr:TIM barrel protein [uncultured Ilyobacter sp.]
MKLLSFIPSDKNMDFFQNELSKYVSDLGFDGIETMTGGYYPMSLFESLNVKGMHLMYFPTWLEFWKGERETLIEDFVDEEGIKGYFGGLSREAMVDYYREEFERAKELGVEYMVFHVSHVRPRDIFTYEFDYSNTEVLNAAAELINEVFIGEGPLLLFENLWWPGLNLESVEETEGFLDSINYKNKGLLLDISHLICSEKNIKSTESGVGFLKGKINSLGQLKSQIKGIHLNFSSSGEYLEEDFSEILEKWEKSGRIERYHIEVSHVKKIDTHHPFESHEIMDILKEIPYEYLVFELAYGSIEELTEKIIKQMKYLTQPT